MVSALTKAGNINSGVATPPLVYEGANAAYMNRENIGAGNTARDYLATPLITIPANGQLRFFTRSTINGDQGTKYKIMVAESPDAAPVPQNVTTNYVEVQQWSEANLTATFNLFEEKIVDLSAYAGKKVYVAFVMEFTQPTAALGGDRWLIDKVRIGEALPGSDGTQRFIHHTEFGNLNLVEPKWRHAMGARDHSFCRYANRYQPDNCKHDAELYCDRDNNPGCAFCTVYTV